MQLCSPDLFMHNSWIYVEANEVLKIKHTDILMHFLLEVCRYSQFKRQVALVHKRL